MLGEVGVPLALTERLWRPPQAQGVHLGVERRPLGVLEDEAGAIHRCRAGTRAGQAGIRGAGGKLRAGGNRARNRAAKAESWLNQERETKKRGGRTHGGGLDPRRGGDGDPSGRAHLRASASLCGPARPRLLCAFTYPHRRAARVLAPARAGGNRRIRAVHGRVRPCLRAPPLLICGLLC